MNATIEDLRPTIIPKSDQLNAEQLLGGPMTVTVTDVRLGSTEEQPVIVHYANEGGRPFKPCKTMRKLLIHAWGADGRQWTGRAMTLYNDPAVKFGGEDVGGIRISHLTDIDRDVRVSLTTTRGKKAKYEVKRMSSPLAGQLADITGSPTVDALKENFGAAYKATKDAGGRAQLKAAYDARMAVLTRPAETARKADAEDDLATQLLACEDVDVLDLLADRLRDIEDDAMRTRLTETYRARRAELA
jgi:hypothetical protein